MPGKGPLPKPAGRRARRNSAPTPLRVVPVSAVPQPPLPEDVEWPEATRRWWSEVIPNLPLAEEFTASDWSFLLDTAVLHSRYWQGEVKLAAELRLRQAKYGTTPEDRVRLRISFAAAEHAETRPSRPSAAARKRYAGLMAIDEDARAVLRRAGDDPPPRGGA